MNSRMDTNLVAWPTLPFPETLEQLSIPKPRKLLARDYKPKGQIPVVDQGQQFISGWTDDETLTIRDGLPFVVFGDHTRMFKYVDFPFALGADGTQLLKPTKDFNPRFFYYACLQLPLPNRGYNRHFKVLKEQTFPKPPRPEQEKIAALLLQAQRAIEAEENLITNARELKQSAMDHLFTRGLRSESQKESDIGPLPQSWKLRPLEELREFLQYGTSVKCDYHGKGRPVLRIPNLVDGDVRTTDLKWCELTEREVTSLQLEHGDLLFIRTNAVRERVGTTAVYRGDPKGALFASYLIRARLKQSDIEPDFYQYFSMTAAGVAQLSGRSSPAADGKFNINTKTIDSVCVPLPSLDEQRKIISILQTIDRKMSVHQRKRATLQELFNTLLNELMTGEIPVDKLDIDTSEVTAG